MGEPISLGKATPLRPSLLKQLPAGPVNQQGKDLRIQLPHLILVGDRQDQAPDGGTGSTMRKFRQ